MGRVVVACSNRGSLTHFDPGFSRLEDLLQAARVLLASLDRPSEEASSKMTTPSEDDGSINCHREHQTRTGNQTDSRDSARTNRSDVRLGKSTTTALGPNVSRQRLCGANMFRMACDLIGSHGFPYA